MNKHTFLNLGANIISFAVTFLISFFITPIIIQKVGKEVYGFYGLSNSFTSYITILTVAINSLAGRFVTISLHQDKAEDANEYFSSVIVVNLIIALICLLPVAVFIIMLEHFLNLPAGHILDIKLTFTCTFATFFINLIFSVLTVATFATNKIYLASIRQIEASILKIGVIFALFACFYPMVAFVAFATLVSAIFVVITNIFYTKRLLPQIKFSPRKFSWHKMKELIFSGMWNSIVALSNVLLEGLDLLISNLFLGPAVMGTISIVKTIPSAVQSLLASMLGVFLPPLTINYAKGKLQAMVEYINNTTKLMGIIFALPIAFIIVMGKDFYCLWLPGENALHLWSLSIISVLNLAISCTASVYYNLFNVTNRLKLPAIVTLCTGILSTVVVLILLKFTSLEAYAIVGVSVTFGILRNIAFNLPYSAKCIRVNPLRFYWYTARSLLMIVSASCIGLIVSRVIPIHNWMSLFVAAGLMCVSALIVNTALSFPVTQLKTIVAGLKRGGKRDD